MIGAAERDRVRVRAGAYMATVSELTTRCAGGGSKSVGAAVGDRVRDGGSSLPGGKAVQDRVRVRVKGEAASVSAATARSAGGSL